mgnify:CR=1 FL=1
MLRCAGHQTNSRYAVRDHDLEFIFGKHVGKFVVGEKMDVHVRQAGNQKLSGAINSLRLLRNFDPFGIANFSDDTYRAAGALVVPTAAVDDEVFWRADGTSFPVEYMSSPILQDGEVVGAVVTFKNITKRKALEQQLHHQAFHDSLSSLPNRALFMDRLEHALTRANRRGSKVAVLFMDLDNFKVINDSLGHKAGDQLLVAVAERLKTCLRPEDTAARLDQRDAQRVEPPPQRRRHSPDRVCTRAAPSP